MREVIDLNGPWRFLPDLDPQYHDDDEYARPDWDRRHWDWMPVPGCWNKQAERYAIYEGVAWYARTFELPGWAEGRVGVLRFGAANYAARVYVNGVPVGEHAGGYTEFLVDASAALRAGENLLAVRLDNRRQSILLPACLGWYNYGGLTRDVTLEVSQGGRLEWAGVEAEPAGAGAAGRWRAEWRPGGEAARIEARIRGPRGEIVWEGRRALAPGERSVEVAFALDRAEPWSPAHPALYTLELALAAADGRALDDLAAPFGVRSLRAQGNKILLNGESIWLKGICYLPDHPVTGFTYDAAAFRRDLDDLQALGVNALRCHVPLHEAMWRECDRRGLLVWSEAPIYCLDPKEETGSAFSDPAYLALARGMLTEMVRAAYNHPSAILWSLGNECKVAHPEAPAFFSELARTVRALDRSRLLSYASLYGEMGEVGDLLDVVGVNEYWGWYDRVSARPGRDRQLERQAARRADGTLALEIAPLDLGRLERELVAKAARYDKPLLLTEFGADAIPGYRADDLALWSEDYQAHCLEVTYEVLRQASHVCGAFPFLYQDYPDPSKYVNAYWDGLNYKGVVTYDRARKAGWQALREIYARIA